MKSLIHKPLSLITKTQIRGLNAFSKAFDNIEYPKDFKPKNIQKYDGK